MEDRELLFARQLCLAVGLYHPRDWRRVRDEHTPYEWLLQQAAQYVDPIGEERADMRSGALAGQLARAIGADSQMANECAEFARYYLKINQPVERILTPEEAAAIKAQR